MGKIGDARTYHEAEVLAEAWMIENGFYSEDSPVIKTIDDGWEVRYEVWE